MHKFYASIDNFCSGKINIYGVYVRRYVHDHIAIMYMYIYIYYVDDMYVCSIHMYILCNYVYTYIDLHI